MSAGKPLVVPVTSVIITDYLTLGKIFCLSVYVSKDLKFISYIDKKLAINDLQQYFCRFSFGGTDEKNFFFFFRQLVGDGVGYFWFTWYKQLRPISVRRNQDRSCWCRAKQFKRSMRTLCTPYNLSFRRNQACPSSYRLCLPKTVSPEQD